MIMTCEHPGHKQQNTGKEGRPTRQVGLVSIGVHWMTMSEAKQILNLRSAQH